MSLIRADARAIPLVDGCVQTVVTSPPYWGLRDYGNSGQIGLEATPDAYVQTLVQVFAECWRVLKDDGTLWLNLGDSYSGQGDMGARRDCSGGFGGKDLGTRGRQGFAGSTAGVTRSRAGLKSKDLVGIPWRVAFALQAAGWYLRSDIIWSKPNPMPESVTDRPTKAHEYIFLLTKHERYYYDAEAVAESAIARRQQRLTLPKDHPKAAQFGGVNFVDGGISDVRNKRSVWHVATQPYSGAHFATWPEKLIEPCILAGTRPGDLVFDPFVGSGTTVAVAERFGRQAVGMDLSYQGLSKIRTRQRGLRFA